MTDNNQPAKTAFSSFVLHLHPRKIPVETLRFRLSFGLGGMAATLIVILMVTGVLQLMSYSPKTAETYLSIQQMYMAGCLAGFIRNIHYWSGNLLVIIAFLHITRVFLTGAFVNGREYNWILGIGLFVLVLFANFTGYLMPWDQRAYWAVTIFTAMLSYVPLIGDQLTTLLRGGGEVGHETLATFFAIHAGVVPALIILLVVWHFWMVRKAGGLVQSLDPAQNEVKRVATVPHLVLREAAVGLGLIALLLLFSALIEAPLGDMADPGESPNPAKAAWYFMGLQELLLHLHPQVAIFIVPLLVTVALLLLPFVRGAALPGGCWFGGQNGRRIAALSFVAGFLTTTIAIMFDDFAGNSVTAQSGWLLRGVFPLSGYCLMLAGVYLLSTMGLRCDRAQAVMSVVLCVGGGIICLTVVGVWFRGPGMCLILPF